MTTSPEDKRRIPSGFHHLRTLPHADGFGPRLAWSRDGELLAVSVGNAIYVYDHDSGYCLRMLETGHEVVSLAFAPGGGHLASGGRLRGGRPRVGSIQVWHLDSGSVVAALETVTPSCLAFNGDGSVLASGHADVVRLWNVHAGELRRRTQLDELPETWSSTPSPSARTVGPSSPAGMTGGGQGCGTRPMARS